MLRECSPPILCHMSRVPCHVSHITYFLANLGKARGCSTNTYVINSFIPSWFEKISLWRRHAFMVEDGAFSHKICYNFQGDSKSGRASKLYNWFKSYGDFAEWVDFVYWWSFSREGSAPAACAAGLFSLTFRHKTCKYDSNSNTHI